MGIEQSLTWVHYVNHHANVIMFRSPCPDNQEEINNHPEKDEQPHVEAEEFERRKTKAASSYAILLMQWSFTSRDRFLASTLNLPHERGAQICIS
jgi:hypothetical protein